jgi:RHS repeat-associated protein
VDGEAPTTTRYTYDANGRRASMTGGDGIRSEYAYDAPGRLRNLVKRTAAGALLMAMSYSVDASGMRTAVEEADSTGTVRTVAWQYDGVKRLTREAIDHREAAHDRSSEWTYDKVGNRLTQVVTAGAAAAVTTRYTYDANDHLLTETADGVPTAYAYDANGNTISKGSPGTLTEYAYDDANRLIDARTPAGRTTYVYDADGLRVRSTHTPTGGAPTTTWYLQDSTYPYAQVIEQHTGDSVAQKRLSATYTFADELVSQTRYDTAGTPSTRFVQRDGFGSTRWVTDAAGSITDSIDYDAFGNEINRTGTTKVEHLYRGEAFDPNVGFYYLRARWMDPSSGRFTQMDRWAGLESNPISLHKYVYGNSDPVNGKDPSGFMTMMDVIGGININSMGRTVSAHAMRRYFKRVITQTLRDVGSARREVRKCLVSKRKCDIELPVLVVGGDNAAMADHIFDAQTAAGTNFVPAGFLHSFNSRPRAGQWYIGQPGCSTGDKLRAIGEYGPAIECDEFPMNAMDLGGRSHHPMLVSLRYVPLSQNKSVGAMWNNLVNSSGMRSKPDKKALVVAWREIPASVYIPAK